MTWEVEYTDEFERWWENDLSDEEQEDIYAAVNILCEKGPTLGRPLVDNVHQSSYPNMKELIPSGSNNRVLFAFDPRRAAILLIGGDKTGLWNEWYDRMVPVADQLYSTYLQELRREGLIR